MRAIGIALVTILIFVTFGLSACDNKSHSNLSPQLETVADQFAAGPPALDSLTWPVRQVDLVGPGFCSLAPQEVAASANLALGPGEAVTLNAAAGTAFAVYGVWGFDGDNGPTSARITVGSLSGGQYYVGFSDYVDGTWRFAGPFDDTAEVEIPLPDGEVVDAYSNPRAFVSPRGACYLAVVLPEGGVMAVAGVELGVHGGQHAPAPPWGLIGSGGSNGFLLTWVPSIDYNDPDFAGYLVQRAPLLSGDFSPGEVTDNPYYLDNTAEIDTEYRYRVLAFDASDNRSVWRTISDGPHSGVLAPPVAELTLPRGPLTGPQTVTLDMSDSFDPEGVGIATYTFDFAINPEAVTGGSSSATVTLQPGCHFVTASVETTDGRVGSTTRTLKIYPAWSDTPVLIQAPDPLLGVEPLRHMRMGLNGRLLFGYDAASQALAFRFDRLADGSDIVPYYVPLYNTMMRTGEGVQLGSDWLFPVGTDTQFYLARFTPPPSVGAGFQEQEPYGAQVGLIPTQTSMNWTPAVALASDGGDRVWMFVSEESGGIVDLVVTDNSNFGVKTDVVLNIGSLNAVDAVYDADRALIHVVYATGASTDYIAWDPATQTASGAQNLAGAWGPTVDVEMDPVTNNVGAAYYHTLLVRFSEWDGVAWSPEELIDNSGNNGSYFDLTYTSDGVAVAYFGLAPGDPHFYVRDAPPVWTARNAPVMVAGSGYEVALSSPINSDEFLVADRDVNGRIFTMYLDNAGGADTLWELGPVAGLGARLQAAAGTDDNSATGDEVLHTVFLNSLGGGSSHYTSEDGGASWVSQGGIGPQLTDLAGTSRGEVYLSNSSFAGNDLMYWDPTLLMWIAALPSIAGDATHIAFLASTPTSPSVLWMAYDDGATQMHKVTGNNADGFTDTVYTPPVSPVWCGAGNVLGLGLNCLTIANGAAIDAGALYHHPTGSSTANYVANPLAPDSFLSFSSGLVRNRALASATSLCGPNYMPRQVFYSAQGMFINPLRYEADFFIGYLTSEIPFNLDQFRVDMRRTASAITASGMTAVGLVGSIDGKETHLEWSNYGEWETLPVPPPLEHAGGAELLLGRDGRWHILYRDWTNDSVYCLSTLP